MVIFVAEIVKFHILFRRPRGYGKDLPPPPSSRLPPLSGQVPGFVDVPKLGFPAPPPPPPPPQEGGFGFTEFGGGVPEAREQFGAMPFSNLKIEVMFPTNQEN